MTDDRQAVKTLAESLVKAMKSVNKTPSHTVVSGVTPSAISASKIVGLPAAFASIISGIESAAADGDAIAQQILTALNHIAAGEFETITADTAMIEKIYATFGDFITLVAEDAQIGNLDVDTIRAGLAEVGLINIGTANIDMAQIKRSSTQTAFIHESVQGQVYIDDLAVSDASIVNLSAGTVLINNSQGELVELYVDDNGDVTTRPVQYSGNGIIIDNSLHGSKIVKNSITTDRLNAGEIFAARSVIMDMIADNIEAARIFANQGFISELESKIISSDLSQNTSIIELTSSINLLSSNTSRTFVQENMPIPVHNSDTWFDPLNEEHYIANSIFLPIQQMAFGHDDNGFLCNEHASDYQFSINANGELAVLFTNAQAEKIITDNNIDFTIVNNKVFGNGLWKKIDNVAFSNLKISVNGISAEVFDSNTGASRITQNANSITSAVQRITQNERNIESNTSRISQNANNITLAVQRITQNESNIEDNTSNITQNADNITLAVRRIAQNESDIAGNKSTISQNTSRISQNANNITLAVQRIAQNESNIENNQTAIRQNANSISLEATKTTNIINGTTAVPYVETSSIKIQNNKIEVKSTGNVDIKASNFSISFNTAGTLTNKSRVDISNTNGIKVSDSYGNYFQATSGKIGLYNIQNTPKVYLDNAGNAHFSGALEAATGTFAGTLSANCINSGTLSAGFIYGGTLTLGGANNANGSIIVYDAGNNSNRVKRVEVNNNGITVYNRAGTTKQFYVDTDGNATFTGKLGASVVTADNIAAGAISIAKFNNTDKQRIISIDSTLTRQQTIYISKESGTNSVATNTTWVTDMNGGQNTWTTVRPVYNSTYPVLFTAVQRQTNIQHSTSPGTACSCTTPVKDQTTTVISGGNITTGTIDASKVTVTNINASNITTGTISASKIKGGTLALGGANNGSGSLVVNDASGTQVGKWDNNGIIISSGSITGGTINGASLTLGGANNGSGSLVVNNASGSKVVELNNSGITVYKGNAKQFYVDGSGNATFAGSITGGTINGASLTLGGANNGSGTLTVYDSGTATTRKKRVEINNNGIAVYKSDGATKQFYFDSTTGDATFAGALSAATGSFSGKLSAATGTFAGNIRSGTDESWVETGSGAINFYVKIPSYYIGGGLEFYSSISEDIVYRRNASGGYDSAEDLYNGIEINTGRITWWDGRNICAEFDKELVEIYRGVNIKGNFTVPTGYTKSKVITTSQYSDRLLYCYETPSPLFGDVGEGVIGDDGLCYVAIDPIFAQTITTYDYQVFLQQYGVGDCYVQERRNGWFVVAGTPGLTFGWEIKGKQADVDQRRLDKNEDAFSVPRHTYGEDAAQHIEDIRKEREVA